MRQSPPESRSHFRLVPLLAGAVLVSTALGCATTQVTPEFWRDARATKVRIGVGVARAPQPKAYSGINGANLAAAIGELIRSALDKDLEASLQKYRTAELGKVASELAAALGENGVSAEIVPNLLEVERPDENDADRRRLFASVPRGITHFLLIEARYGTLLEQDFVAALDHEINAYFHIEARMFELLTRTSPETGTPELELKVLWSYSNELDGRDKDPINGEWKQRPDFPKVQPALQATEKRVCGELVGAFRKMIIETGGTYHAEPAERTPAAAIKPAETPPAAGS